MKDEEATNLIKLGSFFVLCWEMERLARWFLFRAANIGGKNNNAKKK